MNYELTEDGFVYDIADKEKFTTFALPAVKELPSILPQQVINFIATLLQEEKDAKERLEDLKTQLKDAMIANGIKSWDGGKFTATIANDSEAKTFDTTRFKKEHADLYEQYVKTTVRKGAFTLKLKQS